MQFEVAAIACTHARAHAMRAMRARIRARARMHEGDGRRSVCRHRGGSNRLDPRMSREGNTRAHAQGHRRGTHEEARGMKTTGD